MLKKYILLCSCLLSVGIIQVKDKHKKELTRLSATPLLIELISQINNIHNDMVSINSSISTINSNVSTLQGQVATVLNSLSITFNNGTANKATVNGDSAITASGFTVSNGSGSSATLSSGTISLDVYIVGAVGSSLSSFTGLLIVKATDSTGVEYSTEGDFTYVTVASGDATSTSLTTSGTNNTLAGTISMTDGVIALIS